MSGPRQKLDLPSKIHTNGAQMWTPFFQERYAYAQAQEERLKEKKAEVRRKLRERRVPSSPVGRVMGFAQLGASLVYGTVSDQVSQYFRGTPAADSKDGKPANRCQPAHKAFMLLHAVYLVFIS